VITAGSFSRCKTGGISGTFAEHGTGILMELLLTAIQEKFNKGAFKVLVDRNGVLGPEI